MQYEVITCLPGNIAEFYVVFDYTPGRPAKIGSTPDTSYPAEGGTVEISSVSLASDKYGVNLMDLLKDEVLEKITEEVQDWVTQQGDLQ